MNGNARSPRHGCIISLRVSILVAAVAAVGVTPGVRAQEDPDPVAEARKARLELAGGGAGYITARKLGVPEIAGKPVTTQVHGGPREKPRLAAEDIAPSSHEEPRPAREHRPARSENNVAVRDFPNVSENEPTVAANPRDPNKVVAGSHFIGDTANRCVAHYSRDGGKTWSYAPIFMPHLTHESECSDPVLAYAPDGSRVYYAYMDIKFATQFDVVVSYSDDDGKTWKGPVVALSTELHDYDKPWIGTHVPAGGGHGGQGNSNWVYVSSTRFPFTGNPCTIEFTRSSDQGQTWSLPQTLDTGVCGNAGSSPTVQVVQGSRPNGGIGDDVLVAWYHSGTDGWLFGSFQIRTRYSSNNGATFGAINISATDLTEAPFWLGPLLRYHRWWGVMFPDVEIAPDGSAHILYTHDPVPGTATDEDGDIRYVASTGRPYATWSLPTKVNNDPTPGKAQGWATLEAGSKSGRTALYALWEDHRASSTDNLEYDVFYAKRSGAGAWANAKLTDRTSRSDFIFLGDYFDLTIARSHDDDHDGDPFVYGIWTDRRDEPTRFDLDDDAWGSRLPPRRLGDDDDDDGDDRDEREHPYRN